MEVEELVTFPIDVLRFVAWTAGTIVHNFDRGREGRLPVFGTKAFRDVLSDAREESERRYREQKPKRVIGFL